MLHISLCACVRVCVCTYLIASGHDGHHGELVNADLGDANRGQESDLGRAHVGALGQHTLPSPDVVTYWSVVAQKCTGGMLGFFYFGINSCKMYWCHAKMCLNLDVKHS